MWRIVVCDGDETEREQLLEYVRRYSGERTREVWLEGCAGWPGLVEQLKRAEPDAVIVAQNGVEGMDIITSAHLPPGKVIWFSDLDFGVQAYRLCLRWFGTKPVTYRKVEQALLRCTEEEPETEPCQQEKPFQKSTEKRLTR